MFKVPKNFSLAQRWRLILQLKFNKQLGIKLIEFELHQSLFFLHCIIHYSTWVLWLFLSFYRFFQHSNPTTLFRSIQYIRKWWEIINESLLEDLTTLFQYFSSLWYQTIVFPSYRINTHQYYESHTHKWISNTYSQFAWSEASIKLGKILVSSRIRTQDTPPTNRVTPPGFEPVYLSLQPRRGIFPLQGGRVERKKKKRCINCHYGNYAPNHKRHLPMRIHSLPSIGMNSYFRWVESNMAYLLGFASRSQSIHE